jgi:uridylate kinase
MKMKIVLRIGGSVLGSPPNSPIIKSYVKKILSIKKRGHVIAGIVGGGLLSREYIKISKDLDLSKKDQDIIAILVSRLNADIVARKIKLEKYNEVPINVLELKRLLKENRIAIMGGLKPGMTTDTVAAIVAKSIQADLFIKATNQEGVYTSDPKINPKAKKIDRLTYKEFIKISHKKHKPGIHTILDLKAIRILKEAKIKTIILNGFNIENIDKAMRSEKIGTKIIGDINE